MRICLFEDQRASYLEPLASTRPVFELLCGQISLAARQRRYFSSPSFGVIVRPLLANLYRQENPGVPVNDFDWARREPVVFVNGRWLPPAATFAAAEPHVGLVGDEVAYAILGRNQLCDCLPDSMEECIANWMETLPSQTASGAMIHYPWDLVEKNASQLRQDFDDFQRSQPSRIADGISLIGPREQLWISPSAQVEPLVVMVTTGGPVVIDEEAVVAAFSRIEGPCYIGPKSQIAGAKVRAGSTFGPQCRIGGEVETCIIHGHSNKYHDGFLGHSYIGEWVNLGAGTHNSDLRNDYGEVSVPLLQTPIKTGLNKVGCFIGDHTKTGLATLINTGSSIGAFSNLLPAGSLAPRYVPPFCTYHKGTLQESGDLEKLLSTAATVMSRRGRSLTDAHAQLYLQLFEDTAFFRLRAFQDAERRRVSQSA
jgi:UDP-N-acetylglucosamine diphosphorylase/glucosamine-1-phosphate N-acetyltransferase